MSLAIKVLMETECPKEEMEWAVCQPSWVEVCAIHVVMAVDSYSGSMGM